MPKIAEMMTLPDGRLAVVLEPFAEDDGSVSIWTDHESREAIRRAQASEREACALIADHYRDWLFEGVAGDAADEIAEAIRSGAPLSHKEAHALRGYHAVIRRKPNSRKST
jgi:hypothetical protein